MSGSSRLLSEVESASIAGVSIETIRQFRGCGLLDPVKEDGVERFREIDIKTLFYTRTKSAEGQTTGGTPENSVDTKDSATAPASEKTNTPSQEPVKVDSGSNPSSAPESVQTVSSPTSPEQPVAGPIENVSVESKPDQVTEAEGGKNLPVASSISADYMLEINKGLREQLEILREERDWLRARVEKLETRSEREQMLLLSESENIRKLIQQGEQQRKPTWLRGLPWFSGRS